MPKKNKGQQPKLHSNKVAREKRIIKSKGFKTTLMEDYNRDSILFGDEKNNQFDKK